MYMLQTKSLDASMSGVIDREGGESLGEMIHFARLNCQQEKPLGHVDSS